MFHLVIKVQELNIQLINKHQMELLICSFKAIQIMRIYILIPSSRIINFFQ